MRARGRGGDDINLIQFIFLGGWESNEGNFAQILTSVAGFKGPPIYNTNSCERTSVPFLSVYLAIVGLFERCHPLLALRHSLGCDIHQP